MQSQSDALQVAYAGLAGVSHMRSLAEKCTSPDACSALQQPTAAKLQSDLDRTGPFDAVAAKVDEAIPDICTCSDPSMDC